MRVALQRLPLGLGSGRTLLVWFFVVDALAAAFNRALALSNKDTELGNNQLEQARLWLR